MDSEFLHPFDHPLFDRQGLTVEWLRLDKIDPLISGNKWFKLQPLLEHHTPGRPLLSFGGSYSNHLHALARFGQRHDIPTVGVVRGDGKLTPTLEDAQRWGMQLHFLDRQSYREVRDPGSGRRSMIIRKLTAQIGRFDLIPEGGATGAALTGCAKIWDLLPKGYRPDRVLVSVGTGTTLAGLVLGAPAGTRIEGVAAIADYGYLKGAIGAVLMGHRLEPDVNWRLIPGFDLGFGRVNAELSALWMAASHQHLELDPVYTLRMLHTFLRRLLKGEYSPGERILLVHTGGLQGLRGQQERLSRLASAHCGPIPL